MNILFCPNKDYFDPLIVALTSLFFNNRFPIHIFIFESNLSAAQKVYLKEFVEAYGNTITFYTITSDQLPGFKAAGRISLETYYRLLVVDILPKSVDRILYLDVDIIVDKSLKPIYDLHFEEPIAVCPTPLSKLSFEDFLKIDDKATWCYFNAGVILFNLAVLRLQGYSIDNFIATYSKLIEMGRAINPKIQTPPYQDQGILNYVFGATAKYMPSYKFNYRPCHFRERNKLDLSRLARHDPEFATIIHYTNDGMLKPWMYYFEDANVIFAAQNSEEQNNFLKWFYDRWWTYAKISPVFSKLRERAAIRTLEFIRQLPNLKKAIKNGDKEKFVKYSYFFSNLCSKLHKDPNYIEKLLLEKGYHHIAFYGRTLIFDRLREILQDAALQVAYIVEDNCHIGIPAYPRSSQKLPEVDILIVTDLMCNEGQYAALRTRFSFPIILASQLLDV